MERITYRKTLDVHKNGFQFMLQGFETADKLSRVIEISLMASGDAIDLPLERLVAMMYVTTPSAKEPSVNKCTIKDNKVVYEVLPIVEEGITTMQLKFIETSPEGATSVLGAPKFAVEVTKSGVDDGSAEQSTTFTALEDAIAKAKGVYDERFIRMELSSDCIFRAYYADGTVYETDILKKLFHNGDVILSESYAHGNTGVRAGEDTDNSMYYSNVSKSESLNAKVIMENSEEILEEVKLHGVYTAFSVDFETGEVEYVSPSFKFKINIDTGELEADGQTYTFEEELSRVVADWLASNGVALKDLQAISTTHTEEIDELNKTTSTHNKQIDFLRNRVPIELGGTGETALEDLKNILTIDTLTSIPSYLTFVGNVHAEMVNAGLGKNNEDNIKGVGRALAMYARYNDPTIDLNTSFPNLITCQSLSEICKNNNAILECMTNDTLKSFIQSNTYAFSELWSEILSEGFEHTSDGVTKTASLTITDEHINGSKLLYVSGNLRRSHYGSDAWYRGSSITINGQPCLTWPDPDINTYTVPKNQILNLNDYGITEPGIYDVTLNANSTGSSLSFNSSITIYETKEA